MALNQLSVEILPRVYNVTNPFLVIPTIEKVYSMDHKWL